jgi:hypothetical protein
VSDPVGGLEGYEAPEQLSGEEHGTAVDVYFMAKLAYGVLAPHRLSDASILPVRYFYLQSGVSQYRLWLMLSEDASLANRAHGRGT